METFECVLWNNNGCAFDSAEGFESIDAAQKWARGRGGKYRVVIYSSEKDWPVCSYEIPYIPHKNRRAIQTNITIYRREIRNYVDGRESYEYLYSPAEKEMICRGNTDILVIAKDAAEPCGTFTFREGVTGEIAKTKFGDHLLYIDGEATGYTAREIALGVARSFGKYTQIEVDK